MQNIFKEKWHNEPKSRLKKWHEALKSRFKKWHERIRQLVKMHILKRKIEKKLIDWKNNSNHFPLVIKGCRQCGKTFSVKKFAHENYKHVVYINFIDDIEAKIAFKSFRKIDDLILGISSTINGSFFVAGETCLILDEIQECPEARMSLKFFYLDGRFDVIATGSLLGVKGYKSDSHNYSVPVGYEDIITMYPLDYEEFLWANAMPVEAISRLKDCLDNAQVVPEVLHQRFRKLLLHYTIVGGMPRVVQEFLDTHDMNRVVKQQRIIIDEYKDDMMKYAENIYKPRLREAFESIPRQLSKENKKFQYSVIKRGAKATHYIDALQWIEDAGIICRCHKMQIPELPLDGNSINDQFKVYMVDTGLFMSMLEDGTQFNVLQGNLMGYKGAIFENLIADIFTKMSRKLYYFSKPSGMEVDFVFRYKGEASLLEVKATSGNVKSTKTILKHPEKYHITKAIKLGDYNVGVAGNILILPLYMAFLLRES